MSKASGGSCASRSVEKRGVSQGRVGTRRAFIKSTGALAASCGLALPRGVLAEGKGAGLPALAGG